MSMKSNAQMIRNFVDTKTGEALKSDVEILSEQLASVEKKLDVMADFLVMQTSINGVLKFLIKEKYTEEELENALKKYETTQKRNEKEEKSEEKSDEKEEKTDEN